MSDVSFIVVPQLNVNDDSVQLIAWLVQHGEIVNSGDVICEIETSKAATELTAEHGGVIFRTAVAPTEVRVGERIGLIGPTLDAIQTFLSEEVDSSNGSSLQGGEGRPVGATERAQTLAAENGISIEQVAATGVLGTVKESDVRRYMTQDAVANPPPDSEVLSNLPQVLAPYAVYEDKLSGHQLSVTRALRQSKRNILLATIDADVDLTSINTGIRLAQENGLMLSLLHVVLAALGRTLADFPQVMRFHHDDQIYRYHQCDVAFVVRTTGGNLYTPVVRGVDKLDVNNIARICHAAALKVNRGRVEPKDLEGACLTVSHIATHPVTRFVALPSPFQSAILAVAPERSILTLKDGQVSEKSVATITLSYDHTLWDGLYSADFLQRLVEEMGSVLV